MVSEELVGHMVPAPPPHFSSLNGMVWEVMGHSLLLCSNISTAIARVATGVSPVVVVGMCVHEAISLSSGAAFCEKV